MNRSDLNAMFVAATELSLESRWREAIALAQRIVTATPNAYSAWWLLAQGYDHLQQEREAAHAYAQYYQHAPRKSDLRAAREFAATRAGLPFDETETETEDADEADRPLVSFTVTIGGKRTLVQARNDSGATLEAVIEAADTLIQSPNPFVAWLHADRHRELFSSLGDTVLTALAQAQDSARVRAGVERYRDALRRVREGEGVAPFAEMARLSTGDFHAFVTGQDLQPALQQLADADTDDEREAVLAAHPRILDDARTLTFLRILGGLQRDSGARQMLQRVFTFIRNARLGIRRVAPELSKQAQAAETQSREAVDSRSIPAIDAALQLWRTVTADDVLHRVTIASGVAALHLARYELAGDPADLDAACSTTEAALQRDPDPPSLMLPYGYSVALFRRFELNGRAEDLDSAIDAIRRVLGQVIDGTYEEGAARSMLGAMLMRRGQRSGGMPDLDAAVDALRLAVTADADAQGRAARLTNLGTACTERYQVSGNVADLDEAEQAYQEALDAAPSNPDAMSALARVHRARFGLTNDLALLDRAIEAYRAAAGLSTAPLDRALVRNNLSSALRTRFLRRGDPADIDAAIEASRDAVRGLPAGHFHRPGWLENLGNNLRVRATSSGRAEDRAESIAAFEAALAAAPEGSSVWRSAPANMGALVEQEDPDRGLALLEVGFARLRDGPANDDIIEAASMLASAYASRREWKRSGDVLQQGMDALDRLQRAQLSTGAKKAWLARAGDLHLIAAHALLLAGNVEGALVAIERGRARLLDEVLGRDRAALTQLERTGDQRLVQRYRTAAEQVRMLAAAADRGENVRDALFAATRALDDVIDDVRQATGGQPLSRPIEIEDIVAAAVTEGAPLVYLAPLVSRGVAIIVFGESARVHPLLLPSLSTDAVNGVVDRYVSAYRASVASTATDADWRQWQASLDATVAWCWHECMGAVVDALQGVDEAVLIPVGQLGRLPLHAATDGTRSCLDAAVWRYVPSARSLSHVEPATADSILTVDYADAAAPLPFTRLETAVVRQAFTNQRKLEDEHATVAAVLDEARHATVLHFACHATAADEGQSDGGLMLADGVLSPKDMAELRLASGSLAVLSACETGVISERLPDEVLSLASGMLQSGASGVVSSLWSVPDVSTAILMARFYFLWIKEGLTPAAALRDAQRWLRDSTNGAVAAFLRTSTTTSMVSAFVDQLEQTPSDRIFSHCLYWGAFTYVGR